MAQMVKNLPAMQEASVQSLGQEDHQRGEWHLTPDFLPREFHGQKSLVGYSLRGCKESDMTEWLTTYISTILGTRNTKIKRPRSSPMEDASGQEQCKHIFAKCNKQSLWGKLVQSIIETQRTKHLKNRNRLEMFLRRFSIWADASSTSIS